MKNMFPLNMKTWVIIEFLDDKTTFQQCVDNKIIQECFCYPKVEIEHRTISIHNNIEYLTIYWINKDLNVGYATGTIHTLKDNIVSHKISSVMYKIGTNKDWETYKKDYNNVDTK